MKTMYNLRLLHASPVTLVVRLCLLLLPAAGCRKENILLNQPRVEYRSIEAFLTNNSEYRLFNHALTLTGLADSLRSGHGPYTVLALKNTVFQQHGITSQADLEGMGVARLRHMMACHIIPRRLALDDIPLLQYGLRYPTLSGESLWVHRYRVRIGGSDQRGGEMVCFSGAEVINRISEGIYNMSLTNEGDYFFTNGVVHNISKMIQQDSQQTVRSFLEAAPQHSVFVAGLKHFGLWEKLEDDRILTIFAPTNAAFADFGIDEEVMRSLDVSRFIPDRLLGAYIMYDRQFLIRDYDFFLQKDGQYWISDPLHNDAGFYRVLMGDAYFVLNGSFFYYRRLSFGYFEFDYTIGITRLNQPYRYGAFADGTEFKHYLGGGIPVDRNYICGGRHRAANDRLVSNGVIHTMDYVLVHLEEALR